MKAIILKTLIVISVLFSSMVVNAQTDSTRYVITLTNGNEYRGIILSDDGREILIETTNLGKIYVMKAEVAAMKKEEEVNRIINSRYFAVVLLNNGSEIIGHIISDDGKEIIIETDNMGKIYIDKKEVKEIVRKVTKDEIYDGEFQAEGPFTTRYAFSNNALPIKKGQNYAMLNLYGPEAHFAVNDHLNIGIMSTWIGSPIVLATKYTFKSKESKVNFSLGNLTGTSGYFRSFGGYGSMTWGSITLGDRKNNFTLSAGYGIMRSGKFYYNYMNQTKVKENAFHGPAFSAAGIVRIGAKASLIIEGICFTYNQDRNYTRYDYDYNTGETTYTTTSFTDRVTNLLIMPALRIQKTPKKAFQIALAGVTSFHSNNYGNNQNYSRSFPMPMLSWFYKL